MDLKNGLGILYDMAKKVDGLLRVLDNGREHVYTRFFCMLWALDCMVYGY